MIFFVNDLYFTILNKSIFQSILEFEIINEAINVVSIKIFQNFQFYIKMSFYKLYLSSCSISWTSPSIKTNLINE
jgi:hypothetical protein